MIPKNALGAVVAAALLAAPSAASAAPASGSSALTIGGGAASALSAAGVKVTAVAPARARGKVITLPVRTAAVGKAATLGHGGAIRLAKGRRSLTLKSPTVRLGQDGRLTAKVGKATVSILTVDAAGRRLNATTGAAAVKGARVRLTVPGAAAVRRALKLARLRPGVLGTLTVDAKADAASSTGAGGTPTPSTGGGAGSPTAPAPGSLANDISLSATESGPAPLARPATAVDLSTASITWHVRDSFIRYINSGEGTAAADGASADPATVEPGSAVPLVYQFHFPFKDGWYDPVSQTARITYAGTVVFSYEAHGIRLTAAKPEVELAGGRSRAIFTVGNTGEAPKRGVLETLDPSKAVSVTHDPDGKGHHYVQVPGAIPTDAGASTFAGFYVAGDPFGWISMDFATS